MGIKLKVKGNEAVIEGKDSMISKLIGGVKGNVSIRTPFGRREVRIVDALQEDKVEVPVKKTAKKAKAKK